MDFERLQELAALDALGALDGEDHREWQEFRRQSALLNGETAAFQNVLAAVAASLPLEGKPSAKLKETILKRIREEKPAQGLAADKLPNPAPGEDALTFISKPEESEWQPLPVPGASVRLLSMDKHRGYAVVLGKLEPGTRFPAHRHFASESVYILSGDLHVSDHVLHAGDFHSAGAGTTHDVNYSETGCTILAVLSTEDLLAQLHGAKSS